MARLTWGLESRFFEYGVDRAVLYFRPGIAVPWDGIIRIEENTEPPSLEPVYYDGQLVNIKRTPQTFKARITSLTFPEMLDDLIVANGSPELVDSERNQPVHMSYRVKTSSGYQIHMLYNCVFVPPTVTMNSIGSDIDITPFVFDVVCLPVTYGVNIYPHSGNRYDSPNTELTPPPPGSDPSAYADYYKNRYIEDQIPGLPPFIYDPSLPSFEYPHFDDHLDLKNMFPTPHFIFDDSLLDPDKWLSLEDLLYGNVDLSPTFGTPQEVFDLMLGPNPFIEFPTSWNTITLNAPTYNRDGWQDRFNDAIRLNDTCAVFSCTDFEGTAEWTNGTPFFVSAIYDNGSIISSSYRSGIPGYTNFYDNSFLPNIARLDDTRFAMAWSLSPPIVGPQEDLMITEFHVNQLTGEITIGDTSLVVSGIDSATSNGGVSLIDVPDMPGVLVMSYPVEIAPNGWTQNVGIQIVRHSGSSWEIGSSYRPVPYVQSPGQYLNNDWMFYGIKNCVLAFHDATSGSSGPNGPYCYAIRINNDLTANFSVMNLLPRSAWGPTGFVSNSVGNDILVYSRDAEGTNSGLTLLTVDTTTPSYSTTSHYKDPDGYGALWGSSDISASHGQIVLLWGTEASNDYSPEIWRCNSLGWSKISEVFNYPEIWKFSQHNAAVWLTSDLCAIAVGTFAPNYDSITVGFIKGS